MTEIKVLGTVELRRRGSLMPLAPRLRRLLAALTARGGVASVDWLAEVVWGDRQPQAPDAALQTLVSRLRAILRTCDGIGVVSRPGGYQLEASTEQVDAWRFAALVGSAPPPDDHEQRMLALRAALEVWDEPAYGPYGDEPFVQAEVARLEELAVVAREDWAEACLRTGRQGEALAHLTGLLAEHPFRERPVALMMMAQYGAGRAAEALETFTGFRRRLDDELGLEPSPTLFGLQADILSHEGGLKAPAPTSRRPEQLRPEPKLFGRDRERAELADVLRSSSVVTLTGPGGVGKTSLARSVAGELSDVFDDGVVTCELARLPRGASVGSALCTLLRVPVSDDRQAEEQLVAQLQDRSMLMVLDNGEHVVDELSPLVERLSRAAPGLTVLCTSRVPLDLAAEQVFAVPPLDVPDPGETALEELSNSPAVAMFVERARRRRRSFQPDPESMREIGRLCARLDGLPLAIELAASRMDAFTPAELLQRLPWRLSVLRGGAGSDPRHRTLRALVDWSFDGLSPAQQTLLQVAGAFAGSFSLADAEQLVSRLGLEDLAQPGEVAACTAELVGQSLLSRGPRQSQFVLLETVRTYARERAASAGLADALDRAHAEHFAQRARIVYEEVFGAGRFADPQVLEEMVDDLRAAFWWALEHAVETATDLVGALGAWVDRSLIVEMSGWAERLLQHYADRPAPPLSRVLVVAAAGARTVEDLDRAEGLATQALEEAESDDTARAVAHYVLAEVAMFRRDIDQLQEHQRQVAALVAKEPSLAATLGLLDLLVVQAFGYGGDPTAVESAQELQRRAERHDWPVIALTAQFVRAELARRAGQQEAGRLMADTLRRARAVGDGQLITMALVPAAEWESMEGDAGQADGLLAELLQRWRQQGDPHQRFFALRLVVEHLLRQDRPEEAATLAQALLHPRRLRQGWKLDIARVERAMAALGPQEMAEAAAASELSDSALHRLALHYLRARAVDPRPA